MKRLLLCLAPLVILAGCGSPGKDLMPLSKGTEWSYRLMDAVPLITNIRVTEPAYVGREKGWRLIGDLGESRMGWSGSRLRASMLSGVVFDPPLILLDLGRIGAPPKPGQAFADVSDRLSVPWNGRMLAAGAWKDVKGDVVCRNVAPDDPDLGMFPGGGRAVRCRLLVGSTEDDTMMTDTLYRENIGVVRQLIHRPGEESPVNLIYQTGGAASE